LAFHNLKKINIFISPGFSDAQGVSFADQLWNLFFGGSSTTRPFGSAVLDGIDLDIENGGSTGKCSQRLSRVTSICCM
jgi:hypothetical protein